MLPNSAEAERMLGSIKKADETIFGEIEDVGVGGCNSWAFVVPKDNTKCSLIFNLVALNDLTPEKPPPIRASNFGGYGAPHGAPLFRGGRGGGCMPLMWIFRIAFGAPCSRRDSSGRLGLGGEGGNSRC